MTLMDQSRDVRALPFARRELDATVAREADEGHLSLGGYAVLVDECPADANATLYLDAQAGRSPIPLFPGMELRVPGGFKDLWVFNDASSVAGSTISLLVVQREGVLLDLGRRDVTIGGIQPQLDDDEKLAVSLYGANPSGSPGDTVLRATNYNTDTGAPTASGLYVNARMQAFNGSVVDRWRNNHAETILPSAVRASTTLTDAIPSYNAAALFIALRVTDRTVGGAPQTQLQLYADVETVAQSIVVTSSFDPTVGQHFFLVGRGVTGDLTTANLAAGNVRGLAALPIPSKFRIRIPFLADITDLTYSLTVQRLV